MIFFFILFFALIFQFFSISNVFYPITSDAHGYVKPTNEYHDKLRSTLEFFEKQNISKEDIFITTIFGNVLQLAFDTPEDRIFYYSYKDKNRFVYVESIVKEHDSGWIILDSGRNGKWVKGYPKEGNFTIGNKTIQTIQNKEGIQVYRW